MLLFLPAIMLEELTGVEVAAIPVAVAPLPWSFTMGSGNTHLRAKNMTVKKIIQKGKKSW